MIPNLTNRTVLVAATVVAALGIVDAAASGEWDLMILFTALALLQLVFLLRLSLGRVAVPVRADLVRWLRDRADQEGDHVELLADRAIAAWRADLVGTAVDGAAGPPRTAGDGRPGLRRATGTATGTP